jgi:hypothetical protein
VTTKWRPDLEEILVDEALALIVAWKDGQELEGARVRTAKGVTDALREACSATLSVVESYQAVGYGADALIESGEYMAVPMHVVEDESRDIVGFLEDASALDVLDPSDIPPKLWFYAAVIGDEPDGRPAFVRKTNPYLSARPGKFFATLGETLTKIEEPLFILDDTRFDLVVLQDGLVVLNATPFETLFRGAPELTERIDVWSKAVTDHLPISPDSAAILKDAARRNSRFARRLRSIFEQGHLKGLTLTQLRQEAKNQDLDVASLFKGGKLVIDENTDTDTLLRLLNEDLFTGGLSGRKFAADRKRSRASP